MNSGQKSAFFAGRKRGKLALPMRAERVPDACVSKLEHENVCLEAWMGALIEGLDVTAKRGSRWSLLGSSWIHCGNLMWCGYLVTRRCCTREGGLHRIKCEKQGTKKRLLCGATHVRVKRASIIHGVEIRARLSWGHRGRSAYEYTLDPRVAVMSAPCLGRFSQVWTLQANSSTHAYYSVFYVSTRMYKKYTDCTSIAPPVACVCTTWFAQDGWLNPEVLG